MLTEAPPAGEDFVGRRVELDALTRWWREATVADDRRLGLVAGESGVGKTRLVNEFTALVRAEDGIVLRGASFGTGFLAYEPWANALRDLFLRARRDVTTAAAGPRPETAAAIPWLREIVPGARSVENVGTPTEAAVADVVAGICARLAGRHPLVVVLDDVQWADPASVELLTRLLAMEATSGYLILAVERRPAITRGPWHEALDTGALDVDWELSLTRLDRDACKELLYTRAPELATPELAAAIYESSNGNAFVTREVLEYVVERATARDENPADLMASLPRTATVLWAARLDSLSDAARRTLAVAAVLGTEFDHAVVAHLGAEDRGGPDAQAALQEAAAAGLIEQDGGAYRFGHGLLRDHLYGELARVRRQRLHRSIARVLEQDDAPDGAGAPALAFHYLEAGRAFRPEAAHHMIRAARWNFTQGASDTAGDLAERALALLRELSDASDADRDLIARHRLALGEVLVLLGHREHRAVLFDAARHFEAVDNPDALANIAATLICIDDSSAMGDHAAVVDFVERILPRIDDLPPALVARVCARYAVMLDFSGQLERQQALSYRAFEAAQEAGDDDTMAVALYCLRPGTQPSVDVYRHHVYKLLQLGQRTRNLEYQFQGLIQVYWREVDLGDIEAADHALAEAEALVERIPRGSVSILGDDLKLHAVGELAVRRTIQATLAGLLRRRRSAPRRCVGLRGATRPRSEPSHRNRRRPARAARR